MEVVLLGKIFKIIGNFEQDDEWVKPRPNFTGMIAVNEKGHFVGYCDELYDSDQPDINKVRYLYGQLTPCEDSDGFSINFLKLSNYPPQTPLLYYAMDSSMSDDCYWLAFRFQDFTPCFNIKGKADLQIEELPYSDEEYEAIRERFEKLDAHHSILNLFVLSVFFEAITDEG